MEHTKAKRTKKQHVENISFDISVNGCDYAVNATPFTIADGDTMYRLSYNNGPVHVFGWDDGLNRYALTDALADVIPPVVEMEIARKLNEVASEMESAA